MIIREAETSDLVPLAQLFDGYRVWYRQKSDLEGARQFLHDRMKNSESVIFLAQTVHLEAVGFTQLYPLFSSTRMGRLWLLNDLFVSEAYRGQGLSLLLIERAKQLCRDTKAVGMLLETEKSNDVGNALYPRAGFHLEDGSNYYFWPVANQGHE